MMRMLFPPAINSSDDAEQKKIIKLKITHIMSQQREFQKTQRLLQQVSKINNTNQGKGKEIPLIKPGDSKAPQQNEKKEVKIKARK